MDFNTGNQAAKFLHHLGNHALWPMEPTHLLVLTAEERVARQRSLVANLSQVKRIQKSSLRNLSHLTQLVIILLFQTRLLLSLFQEDCVEDALKRQDILATR